MAKFKPPAWAIPEDAPAFKAPAYAQGEVDARADVPEQPAAPPAEDWGDAKHSVPTPPPPSGHHFSFDAEGNAVDTEKPGVLRTLAHQFSNGSMGQWFDEAAGKAYELGNAARNVVNGVPLEEADARRDEDYRFGRDTAREDSLKERAARPGLSAGASLGGTLAQLYLTRGAGAGVLGGVNSLGASDADLTKGDPKAYAKAAGSTLLGAGLGTALGAAANKAPVLTGTGLGSVGLGLGLFGGSLGMSPADRLESAAGGGLAFLGAGAEAARRGRNAAAEEAQNRAGRAFDEAIEGRKANLASAESKLQDLGDEKATKLVSKAKAMEANLAADTAAGKAKDEAAAMKAAAAKQAELERANEKFQRILKEEAKAASQSKAGSQKLEAARAKALAKLEADLAGVAEEEAAAGRSKEGAIGRGYQSDYAADHQYGDVPDTALSPPALERRQLLAGKKAEVANRRYQEPLPEDRAQADFDASMKALAAKRAQLMQQLERAKAPPQLDAPDAMPDYALPGELVPKERIDAIARDLGLDAGKFDPRSYKALPFAPAGRDNEATGVKGFVKYSGDRRTPSEPPIIEDDFTEVVGPPPLPTGASRKGVVDSPAKAAQDAKDAADLFKLQRRIDNQQKAVGLARSAATPEAIQTEGAKALQTFKDQQQVRSFPDLVRTVNPFAAPTGALKDPAARFAHFSALASKLGADKSLSAYVPMLETAAVMSDAETAISIYNRVLSDPRVQERLASP